MKKWLMRVFNVKDEKGLTLIELLAVIVILGIIAAIAVPAITGITSNTKKEAHKANARQLVEAAKQVVAINGYQLGTWQETSNKAVLDESTTAQLTAIKPASFSSANVYTAGAESGGSTTAMKITAQALIDMGYFNTLIDPEGANSNTQYGNLNSTTAVYVVKTTNSYDYYVSLDTAGTDMIIVKYDDLEKFKF